MYRYPSKFQVSHSALIGGKWYTIKSISHWEGCVRLTFKQNGDVHYMLDTKEYEYQIPGMMT